MKTILVDAVNTFVIQNQEDNFSINTEMKKILDTYPNKKIILTNTSNEQMERFNLKNIPYPLFTLKHNPDKIDPEYYRIFLREHNLKAEDVVYFEHHSDAVKSAESAGIQTYHYDKDAQDIEALKTFLDNALKEE